MEVLICHYELGCIGSPFLVSLSAYYQFLGEYHFVAVAALLLYVGCYEAGILFVCLLSVFLRVFICFPCRYHLGLAVGHWWFAVLTNFGSNVILTFAFSPLDVVDSFKVALLPSFMLSIQLQCLRFRQELLGEENLFLLFRGIAFVRGTLRPIKKKHLVSHFCTKSIATSYGNNEPLTFTESCSELNLRIKPAQPMQELFM
ncbi:hypothetical protein GOBAR_AA09206 [Gossypium barbadense]|uniref:Uncharacterized protein n=1 Tax=Gossypium barbadense TaxID=3634 RepID=A0A2P5Y772_GOSBA|nr:hypothetical protein GOBAR_AA09206 [Gossypium barbadense]